MMINCLTTFWGMRVTFDFILFRVFVLLLIIHLVRGIIIELKKL